MSKLTVSPINGSHPYGPSGSNVGTYHNVAPRTSSPSPTPFIQTFIVTSLYLIGRTVSGFIYHTFTGATFLFFGTLILTCYDWDHFVPVILLFSMFGAVGGAIFAFPFAALFTLFIRYMNRRPSRPVDEEDPRRPLLSPPPPYAETTHAVQGVHPSQSSAVREAPSRGIIFTYGDQRTRSAAHNLILRDGLAQAGIWLLSPLIGAASGVIGSLVVGRVDGYFYTIQDVAVAGAVGGLFCLLFHALTLFGCQG